MGRPQDGSLARFAQMVAEVEAGLCPDRQAATEELLARLCCSPWPTHEERSFAQGLVARLERLRWAESPPTLKQVGPLTQPGFRVEGRPQAD